MSDSLFTQIGGKDAVGAAVELFYEKVLADPTVNFFFSATDIQKQKGKQKAFLTYAFGGAPNYSGKSMRQSHASMNINEAQFAAVAGHLQSTLEQLEVPQDLVEQVMSIAASTHDDILGLN